MMKTKTLAALFVLATTGIASAGGTEDSLGIGVEGQINGETGGVSLNYDLGKMHIGGFLGFRDFGGDDDTDYTLGGRFFYHVHSTAMSDFGIGGSLGLYSEDGTGPMMEDRDTRLYLEPSFQIRLFLAANVALSFTGGIVIGLADADEGYGTALGGQVTALAGVHYYFF